MKYFVNIKEPYYNRDTKELFYKRLMAKRLGKENYTIHKNRVTGTGLLNHIIDNEKNYFLGYTIEFNDKLAFSKFKLSYKSLLNPSLETPSTRIEKCRSFTVDDDYIEIIKSLYAKYKVLSSLVDATSKCDYQIYRIIDGLNSLAYTITNCKNIIESETFSNMDIDKNIIDLPKYENILETFNSYMADNNIRKLSYYEKSEQTLKYEQQLSDIKNKMFGIFENVVDLEIPTKK